MGTLELILLILILFLTPYLIALFIIFGPPDSIIDYILYKKYKKAKEEWHYITSTDIGMNRSRWIFILMVEIIALFFGFYILININHPHDEILTFSLIFLFIMSIYDKLNPASGTVEIYKEGIAVYIKIFNTLKPFLNYYLVLPWKFFKGYKLKVSKKNIKYVVLIPKSKLFFDIYLIDEDGKVEEAIKNYLNHIQ
ncbi:hypothetical protein JH146_1577 [Methanocaldococcus bathoardescens]|uniref:Uncharacterized protein n=1 Tax=Methanocaldococcus bathoardescens TaxID=1301915 RepID=A0A076LL85_9EURY|nr:hypothetical protein [Methanocaldococcus bathoardescens]AIJ06419.1 hypothetical protein JH146_1577 [Methanocaldococcus bathoardescens]